MKEPEISINEALLRYDLPNLFSGSCSIWTSISFLAARSGQPRDGRPITDLLAAIRQRLPQDYRAMPPFGCGPADICFIPATRTMSDRFWRADPIREPAQDLIGRIDLVLTNPPFGEDRYRDGAGLERMRADGLAMGWVWTRDRPQKRMVNRANPAVLFVDRALQLLRTGGSLAVIVPNSLLSGRKYLYFRDYLMGRIDPEAGICDAKAIINASISLPQHTFAPSGTSSKVEILCLTKASRPEIEDYSIFMAVVDHVGYLYRRKQVIPDPEGNELIEVVEEYHKHKKGSE